MNTPSPLRSHVFENGLRRFVLTPCARRVRVCLRKPGSPRKLWPLPHPLHRRCAGSENGRGQPDCTWQKYGAGGLTIQCYWVTGSVLTAQLRRFLLFTIFIGTVVLTMGCKMEYRFVFREVSQNAGNFPAKFGAVFWSALENIPIVRSAPYINVMGTLLNADQVFDRYFQWPTQSCGLRTKNVRNCRGLKVWKIVASFHRYILSQITNIYFQALGRSRTAVFPWEPKMQFSSRISCHIDYVHTAFYAPAKHKSSLYRYQRTLHQVSLSLNGVKSQQSSPYSANPNKDQIIRWQVCRSNQSTEIIFRIASGGICLLWGFLFLSERRRIFRTLRSLLFVAGTTAFLFPPYYECEQDNQQNQKAANPPFHMNTVPRQYLRPEHCVFGLHLTNCRPLKLRRGLENRQSWSGYGARSMPQSNSHFPLFGNYRVTTQ